MDRARGVFWLRLAARVLVLKSHFSGLAYAVHRGHGHGKSSLTFIALESGIAATAFTVLACARTGADEKAGHATEIKPDQRFMWFLAMMTLGPLMLTALLAAINHTGARLMWGVPMLSFTGLLAVALLAPNLNAPTLKRLLAATAAVLIILPVAHALTTYAWPAISKKPRRENWPQAEISAALRKAYEDEVGRPPTIIAGEIGNWLSGLVAVSGTKMLPVYTNADQALSPWITPDRLATEGALVVWDEHNGGPGNLETLIGSNERHVMTFAIPRAGSGKPAISAGYAIVRPQK